MDRSGPGMVDHLHGACMGGLQDRLFSAAASVCITREAWKHGRLQYQSTGYLRTRGQEASLRIIDLTPGADPGEGPGGPDPLLLKNVLCISNGNWPI